MRYVCSVYHAAVVRSSRKYFQKHINGLSKIAYLLFGEWFLIYLCPY